jgi:hypothetical protein
VRAGVALLYAHWEGWIKNVASYYVEYVHNKNVCYAELAPPLLSIALQARLRELIESDAAASHVGFAHFVQTQMGTRAALKAESAIRTESNLSSRVLKDIVSRIGISYTPYELYENLIDESLVRTRNRVAHGEYEVPTVEDFRELQARVVAMLNAFTVDVRNAAATGAYHR